MAESTTKTIFVIKNNNGQFLEYQSYTGLRVWVSEYSDRCNFESQNAATLYCRSLIADAETHGVNAQFDVYRHNNTVTTLGVTIPDAQRATYGLSEKATEETADTQQP
ncbi:hypothetical protein OIY87_03795 [Streptococcus gallolyticus]|uniref:hypothetical protein n=1 Tax=Streptococcus gallolyticus TaxID=315405 RepID=UPI0022B6706D|nr:hypothetical protein [Streptococcus gallolyticus]WAW99481.1 hypothetical protein OIY87_03795 [Streptococcus gallolyticus]